MNLNISRRVSRETKGSERTLKQLSVTGILCEPYFSATLRATKKGNAE